MASKKGNIDNDTLNMFSNLGGMVKESRAKEREEQAKKHSIAKPFTKPNTDYYRLDLVVRDTVPGSKGHNITVEDIKTDYRAYLDSVRGTQSIAKYIHGLIDKDMKKHSK